MLERFDGKGARSAAAFLAIAAIALSVLHGAVPHQRSASPCHDCESPASSALPQPVAIASRPEAPPVPLPLRADARPGEDPDRRQQATRAPPSPAAA